MKLNEARKLFVGLRVDAAMKRQMNEGAAKGRPIFKAGDPAHLEVVGSGDDLYIGRIVDAGFSVDQVEDLKRNIRSIVGITFPEYRNTGAPMRLFAVEDEDEGAASRDLAATA